MIPDEAVEAAGSVLVYHQRKDITSCMCGWAELGKSHAVHQAQLALHAAAPHLMAAAWDEAVSTLYMGEAINQDHMKAMWAHNPYRKPTDV